MPEPLAPRLQMGLTLLVLVLLGALPARAESLEAAVDRIVTRQLAQHRIPGATVAVVRDGRVALLQGYGEAEVGGGIPVDAERTRFRVASVGKLFVWTAVMRLVEQGRLDLDADVNTWLEDGLRRPPGEYGPLTLRHLMAHTGGHEVLERLWPAGPVPDSVEAYLQTREPQRVRPPGELSAYSDYGTTLAQHLVERVTGQRFEDHLRETVWEPLGMRHTLFRRTVPPPLVQDVARGHDVVRGQPRAEPVERVVVASSGSMLTTAADVSRFMLAHLRGGEVDGQRVLGEDTVRRMHRQHFTHHDRLAGWAHGFMEFHVHGQRLIGHTGDAYQFISLLALVPERGWGLFVSYNGLGEKNAAQHARMELLEALLGRDFPAPRPILVLLPTENAERFAGSYQTTWRAYGTSEASLAWRQEVHVSAYGGASLILRRPDGSARSWVEIEPLLFRPTDDPQSSERIAFRADNGGRITHLFLGARPQEAYERAPWYDAAPLTLALLAGCAGLFGLTVLGVLVQRTPAQGVLAGLAGCHLLVLAGVTLLLRPLAPFDAHAAPGLLAAVRWGALLTGGLTPGLLFWSARARGSTRTAWLGFAMAVALGAALLTAWLYHWRLLAGR
ncbi:serine hydrolase domain-containing protein [Archangium primigenium]|uniref:serine hydrolase domain-containing protein n=1 Tax=[Archangium] primigenium TaxID=2792470 RepID=UPI00195DE4BF|nr:serine hydrolase domain-containing protein [Archangium primigenium]MBM7118818.1 beta-lactamase family protein [Archangium primigenium]